MKLFKIFLLFFLFPSLCFPSVLLLYRLDVPFYRQISYSLSQKGFDLCPLENWPSCLKSHKKILVFGDMAYNHILNFSSQESLKIFAFFVTKCKRNTDLCCCLFPTLKEVLSILKKNFPKNNFLVLYTKKTEWWIKDPIKDPSIPNISFFCLDILDIKESLRKAFNSKAQIYILAPDLLFMHPAFLKRVVRYSFIFSKILVGLSLKMQSYGVPVIIYRDHNYFWKHFDVKLLNSEKITIPLRISIASWFTQN